jgi:CDP-glycerol glycerophosphotransferase
LYYPYDYEKYITQDRAIQFDYEWITAGEICHSQKELLIMITKILLEGKDEMQLKRDEVCALAFTYKDGKASERISNEIHKITN